jgi:asparagine synthase (glutamine-hydrolysing)
MCGIAGTHGLAPQVGRAAVEAMCGQMLPRGPDDVGLEVVGEEAPVVLGNRRLAVIDLSAAGHQPMTDEEGRATIVFNGMIYNFRELRAQLEQHGARFLSECDTEVVLKAYEQWGDNCVCKLRGMFAFAIWDGARQRLVLARDRLGIKPLYYAKVDGRLLFASQVKALLATGMVSPELSPEGIQSYLAWGAVSDPLTAIRAIRSLPAAHLAVYEGERLHMHRYWQLPVETHDIHAEEAAAQLKTLLADTVSAHLVSDAPVGIFLSGGIDSSVLAAVASAESSEVRTVSVAFEEPSYNEAPYARLVADRIGSNHHEVTLRAHDLLDSLDDAFQAMDQPSFDGLNTYAVAGAASAVGLKVALSGLGGDELFNGYGYVARVRQLELARRLPSFIRRPAAAAVAQRNEKLAAWLRGALPRGHSYELLRRVFLPDEIGRLMRTVPSGSQSAIAPWTSRQNALNHVACADLDNYTKNVLLRDTDCMSMAHSLEVRVPFLDSELVEWALSVPAAINSGSKDLLVRATRHLLPAEILERSKQGFALATPEWLRGDLREEVGTALTEPPQAIAELLDAAEVRRVWQAFDAVGGRWSRVWALYSLARWAETVAKVRVPAWH